MADRTPHPPSEAPRARATSTSLPKMSRAAALNKLYALPAPLRTFPLPTLVPHNPISLFHILYVWLSQTINPPSSHFETPYYGWWSPETRSVHVTDSRSIRGLWEQGFYGKGSLSRSEPNWLNGQKAKSGGKVTTSEDVTRKRRAERQQTKWERARKEREAIEQRRLEEAEAARLTETDTNGESTATEEETFLNTDASVTTSDSDGDPLANALRLFQSPVGPLELLSLPNSLLDLENYTTSVNGTLDKRFETLSVTELAPSDGHIETLDATRPNLALNYDFREPKIKGHGLAHRLNGHAKTYTNGNPNINDEEISGSIHSDETAHTSDFNPNGSAMANGTPGTPKMKRQKSVRFSPTVEKNTFVSNEPPSPEHAALTTIEAELESLEIEDQEHFQLTPEEAFFLSYSLGVLIILDPNTKSSIPNEELFTLFRKSSYFPSLSSPSTAPDDPFMLNYVVYHHFRSLGWVIRGGIKFATDYMLYNRGPVFSHAEFGVIILPSYSDPYWSSNLFLQNYVKGKEKRTWSWFHCINRVINQVKKTLVLVYVDIPKPLDDGAEKKVGVDGVLGRYKIREVVMQRWLSNRQRD